MSCIDFQAELMLILHGNHPRQAKGTKEGSGGQAVGVSVGGSAIERREASVTWEIKSSEIKLGAKLGQGAFGAVYKACDSLLPPPSPLSSSSSSLFLAPVADETHNRASCEGRKWR
jgi:hypothetical protein